MRVWLALGFGVLLIVALTAGLVVALSPVSNTWQSFVVTFLVIVIVLGVAVLLEVITTLLQESHRPRLRRLGETVDRWHGKFWED